MIVHTAVDAKYCKAFVPTFVANTRQFMPDALISLVLVDSNFDLHGVEADITYHDKQSFDDIKANFGTVDSKQALGYYPLSRFVRLPVTDHNVMVRDVDTLAVCDIDIVELDKMLQYHDVVNLVRRKHNNTTGGIGAIVFSQRVCGQIQQFAWELLQQKSLYWTIDEEVKFYCQQHLNYIEIERYGTLDNLDTKRCFDNAWIVHAEAFPHSSDLAITLKQRSFEKIKKLYRSNTQ
jgi:hypothetical protein